MTENLDGGDNADVVELPIGKPDAIVLSQPQADLLAGLAEKTKGDAGAPFEPDAIDALNILAETNLAEFQRVRKALKAAGCPLTALEKEMAARRRADPSRDDGKQGQRLQLSEPEPYPGEVPGEWLLDMLERWIRMHVVVTEAQATAVALWCIHTHLLDVADNSPRLHIDSPVPGCGKTILLSTIAPLVLRPLPTENVTQAAMFRVIEMAHPTLLIDEVDAFLQDNEEMRSLLNASYGRDGAVLRTVGDEFEVREFKVWGAVALAGIGKIPNTIEERSVTIHLRRRLPTEKVTRLRNSRREHLEMLGRCIARWVLDNRARLVDRDPVLPEKLGDRERDNWRPLVAIADAISSLAGGAARRAALTLAVDDEEEDDSAGIMALTDVATAFRKSGADYILSAELVTALCNDLNRPWAEWRRGRALTQNSLARLLKPFRIKPRDIKEANNLRGYDRAAVEEAKRRYLDRYDPAQLVPAVPRTVKAESSTTTDAVPPSNADAVTAPGAAGVPVKPNPKKPKGTAARKPATKPRGRGGRKRRAR